MEVKMQCQTMEATMTCNEITHLLQMLSSLVLLVHVYVVVGSERATLRLLSTPAKDARREHNEAHTTDGLELRAFKDIPPRPELEERWKAASPQARKAILKEVHASASRAKPPGPAGVRRAKRKAAMDAKKAVALPGAEAGHILLVEVCCDPDSMLGQVAQEQGWQVERIAKDDDLLAKTDNGPGGGNHFQRLRLNICLNRHGTTSAISQSLSLEFKPTNSYCPTQLNCDFCKQRQYQMSIIITILENESCRERC